VDGSLNGQLRPPSYINMLVLRDGQKIAAAAICDFPLASLKNLSSFTRKLIVTTSACVRFRAERDW
jgi:hypothetical protein